MPMNRIQFQQGMSLPEFMASFGTEEQCAEAVKQARWPQGFECPRCGSALHARKVDSINRTWALVLTAFILYIPANVYPVMTVISFGSGEPDTILSGVMLSQFKPKARPALLEEA